MQHLIIAPPPELARFVKCFWLYKVNGLPNQQIQISTFANDGAGITIVLGDTFVRGQLQGQLTKPGIFSPATKLQVMGVQFYPCALHELFGMPACELTDQYLPIDALAGWDFSDALLNEQDVVVRLRMLCDLLRKTALREKSGDALIRFCLEKIHLQKGLLTVARLLDSLALSERQLERRFSRIVGVPPRHYLKVIRFKEALRQLRSGNETRLIDLALSLEYADQAHFNRHVRQLSGLAPKELHKRLNKTTVNRRGSSPYLVDILE